MRYIELLVPARTADIGIEAIRHGADAVYIGGPAFGARKAACNSIKDIARLCSFAKPFHVKVYVTLNTLIHDEEKPLVENIAWELYEAGASALIIQDLSLLNISNLPPIPLHASTQMDNRTADKVAYLSNLGFEQVVLARELGIADIAAIHKAVSNTKLEVFIHGALCTGLSGRCHASERLFNRSADRGECAQFCRLAFNLEDEHGNQIVTNRHLLSLRDMNRSAHIENLLDAGVTSLKIEGRLKDLPYVKNITAFYRQLLDEIITRRPDEFARSSIGNETICFKPNPNRTFNRGYTDYLNDNAFFSPFTPKSTGEYIGKTLSMGRDYITLNHTIAAGDGLCYFNNNHELKGFRVNRTDGKRIYPHPFPRDLGVGTPLYRNQDSAFDKMLAGNTATRTIPIGINLCDTHTGFRITASIPRSSNVCVEVEHPHKPAHTNQIENITRQFSRLGNTPYRAAYISVNMADNWFIPSSILTEWRRRLVHEIISHIPCHPTVHERRTTAITTQNNNDGDILMFCRHCLRRELDICPHGKKPAEILLHIDKNTLVPLKKDNGTTKLFLCRTNGRRFALLFDCKNCQMLIHA